jgi:SHS2 domain-containing protein
MLLRFEILEHPADAERLVFGRVEVTSLGEGQVTGVAYRGQYDCERHRAGTAVKAVTYHRFFVKRLPSEWVAEVFLDL